MRFVPTLPLFALCLAASLPVFAETDLGAFRASASRAANHLEELRAQQSKLRAELDDVAKRIEASKPRRQGSLVPAGDLQRDLKRSQKLSSELAALATQLSAAELESRQQTELLIDALNQRLFEVRGRWAEAPSLEQRRKLVVEMKELRAEREQLRLRLTSAEVPPIKDESSEDPEELMAQADALRDTGDKVQQQVIALRSRIAEARAERELELRMADFARDETLFDERDRRVRSRGSDSQSSRTSGAGFANPTHDPTGGAAAPPTPPSTGTPPEMKASGQGIQSVTVGSPQISGGPSTELGSAGDNLSAMEQKLIQLQTLAKRLEQRAREAEVRAKALRP